MDTMKIVIPEALKRRFKKACIDHDSNMSEIVCSLVQAWLDGRVDLESGQPAHAESELESK